VELFVTEDVGLPQHASVSASVITGINGGDSNVATRTYSITADFTQADTLFESCFSATNANANPLGAPITIMTCAIVSVEFPELRWFDSQTPGDIPPPKPSDLIGAKPSES